MMIAAADSEGGYSCRSQRSGSGATSSSSNKLGHVNGSRIGTDNSSGKIGKGKTGKGSSSGKTGKGKSGKGNGSSSGKFGTLPPSSAPPLEYKPSFDPNRSTHSEQRASFDPSGDTGDRYQFILGADLLTTDDTNHDGQNREHVYVWPYGSPDRETKDVAVVGDPHQGGGNGTARPNKVMEETTRASVVSRIFSKSPQLAPTPVTEESEDWGSAGNGAQSQARSQQQQQVWAHDDHDPSSAGSTWNGADPWGAFQPFHDEHLQPVMVSDLSSVSETTGANSVPVSAVGTESLRRPKSERYASQPMDVGGSMRPSSERVPTMPLWTPSRAPTV